MKKYTIYFCILFLICHLTGCVKETPEEAASGAAETLSSDESNTSEKEQRPIKLNSNKRYVKHREVNRRLIHRVHRLHRNKALA